MNANTDTAQTTAAAERAQAPVRKTTYTASLRGDAGRLADISAEFATTDEAIAHARKAAAERYPDAQVIDLYEKTTINDSLIGYPYCGGAWTDPLTQSAGAHTHDTAPSNPSPTGRDTTMNDDSKLTEAQRALHDQVLAAASWDGSDCKDVLDRLDAPAADKAAVADVLGGPGAGAARADDDQAAAEDDDSADAGWTVAEAREVLGRLADDGERAAAALAADAADPRGTLQGRGYTPADAEVADWQARHQDAAVAARQHAERLREQATGGDIGDPARAVREAELLTRAAELGGILIDGSRLAGSDQQRNRMLADLADRGRLEHVAEPGQVPFYRLVPERADADSDEQPTAQHANGGEVSGPNSRDKHQARAADAAVSQATDDGHDDTDGM